jgi:hypothetical protein
MSAQAQGFSQIETLVPVRVQGTFADTGSLCLLAIDGGDGEGVGEAWYNISIDCEPKIAL